MTRLPVRDSLIEPGQDAPRFTLPDQNRAEWSLDDALATGDVVLCFFPFAFTGVCEQEMRCVSDDMDAWKRRGATVVGISCDSFAALKAWADHLGLSHTLLSDLHRTVCRAYGLYWPQMNVAARGTVVIGSDGKVRWAQKREPKDPMNLDDVLAHLP